MPDGRGDEQPGGGAARSVGLRTRVVDAAAGTPAHRDRYVDLLRAVAIVVVVLGHWLVAAVTVDGGRLGWVNALAVLTWAHPLTWLVQVMPVVFLVGGYANAASWASRASRGESVAGWVRGRALRLLRPTAAFLAFVVAAYAVAVALGADPVVARTAVWAAAMSLWFLVVYLVVVSIAPALLAADRRWGLWGVLVLVAVVALGDVARVLTGRPGGAAASYVAAWVAIHQVGVAWRRGALTRVRRHAWALAGGGLTTLVALTGWGPYAVTMVGAASPPALSNTAPPTLALLALAAAQTGVVLLLRPAADRWLRRPRVWLAVVAVNAVVLTVFLWHMVPVVIVGTTLVAHGVLPQHDVGSGLWWAWRVPWLVLLAALLVAIVVVAGRWERPRAARPAEQAALTTAAGVVLSLAGLAGLGVGGPDGLLPDVGGIPVGELLLFATGFAILVGRPRRPTDRGRGGRLGFPHRSATTPGPRLSVTGRPAT